MKNTDYWPHLSRIAERRGSLYAELLRGHVSRRHVCDLNCGTAPVFPHLRGYASYYGNDVNEGFIQTLQMRSAIDDNVLFECKKDVDVRREQIDVLMLLGCGGCTLHRGDSPESREDIRTLFTLIRVHLPQVVMVEFASECVVDFHDISGYRRHTSLEIHFDPSGDVPFMRRRVLLYTRDNK